MARATQSEDTVPELEFAILTTTFVVLLVATIQVSSPFAERFAFPPVMDVLEKYAAEVSQTEIFNELPNAPGYLAVQRALDSSAKLVLTVALSIKSSLATIILVLEDTEPTFAKADRTPVVPAASVVLAVRTTYSLLP